MNLWQQFRKTQANCNVPCSFSLRFEHGIEDELRALFSDFAKWLRQSYVFPVPVRVYVKNCETVRLLGGARAYGGFRYFEHRNPYIRIPAKIEESVLREYKKEDAYEMVLSSLVHELTHYFQWVLRLEQSNATSERQANYYRYRIIDAYKASISF